MARAILWSLAPWGNLSTTGPSWVLRFDQEIWSVTKDDEGRNHACTPTRLSFLGTLARIGTNTLVTSDIDLVNRMNAPRSLYTRSDWYLGFRLFPGTDNIFSTRDEKVHSKRRGQMNLGVSFPSLYKEDYQTQVRFNLNLVYWKRKHQLRAQDRSTCRKPRPPDQDQISLFPLQFKEHGSGWKV